MPKAKPTQVIVHRIELQQSERDAMEAALAGQFVTNAVSAAGSVLSGIGTALVPFAGVLTAIGAAYIAEKGISEVIEKVKEAQENVGTVSDWFSPSTQQDAYTYICTYLQANTWDTMSPSDLNKDIEKMNAHPVLKIKLTSWLKLVKQKRAQTGSWPSVTPFQSWKSYYPPATYAKDVATSTLDAFNPF
jgi:hypothetical protein